MALVVLHPALGRGGNDLIASTFSLNVFAITWFMRIALFVVPPLVFIVTKRICFGLQRRDRDKLLHGYESGVIKRLPNGKYYEQHRPISDEERAVLMARASAPQPLPMPEKYDENGIKQKGYGVKRLQARLSHFFYAERIPMPTPGRDRRGHAPRGRDHRASATTRSTTPAPRRSLPASDTPGPPSAWLR